MKRYRGSRRSQVLLPIVLGCLALLAACGGGTTKASEQASNRVAAAGEDWSNGLLTLPAPPLSARSAPLVAATNRQVVVLSGNELGQNGRQVRLAAGAAVFDEVKRAWTDLELPFSAPLFGPGAVWTGRELIVVGVPCGDEFPAEDSTPFCPRTPFEAASYVPDEQRFAELPAPPEELLWRSATRVWGVGWTGTHALFKFGGIPDRYALYDPSTQRWAMLSNPPGDDASVCVASDQVLAVDLPVSQTGSAPAPEGAVIRTFTYAQDNDAWNEEAQRAFPEVGQFATRVLCQGNQVVVAPLSAASGTDTKSVLWRNTGSRSWDQVPTIPETFADGAPALRDGKRFLWTGFGGSSYFTLSEDGSQWDATPKPDLGAESTTIQVMGENLLITSTAPGTNAMAILDTAEYGASH